MKKKTSPYIAITGCPFLFSEFVRLLPVLMSAEADRLMKEEVEKNELLQVNSMTSRKRFISEIKKRYASVPVEFWNQFLLMDETGQRAGMLYVILKTYKLAFDCHFNVTIKRWSSIEKSVSKNDLMMELNEISAKDEFVESWTEQTKNKSIVSYLNFIRHAGLINEATGELQSIKLDASNAKYYFQSGEEWFLEACLLYPYEINEIKSQL